MSQILPSSIRPICLRGADVEHRLGLVLNRIVSPIVMGAESRLMRNENAKPRLSIRLAGILIIV
jgi:hypothetical protein